VPDAILEAELYPLFGGYWGYQAAPLQVTLEQRLVFIARKDIEAQQHAKQQAEIEEQRREIERRR